MVKRSERNLSIEVLRILAMMGIILIHVQTKTGWLNQFEVGKPGWGVSWGIHAVCMTSVNLYVLISGYFLSRSKVSFKKVLVLWTSAFTWGLVVAVIDWANNGFWITPDYLVGLIFPISTRKYWFLTVYIALYLLAPFINKLINALSQRQHHSLIVLSIVLFSIMPSVIPYGGEDGIVGVNGIGGTNLVWFVVLYIIAAYIRKYSQQKTGVAIVKYPAVSAIAIACILVFQWVTKCLDERVGFGGSYGTWFYNYSSILSLIASLGFFKLVLSTRMNETPWKKKVIFFLAQGTLGIYLFHEAPRMRLMLWPFVEQMNQLYLSRIAYPVKILVISSAIFIFGCVAEHCRIYVFRWMVSNRLVVMISSRIDNYLYTRI